MTKHAVALGAEGFDSPLRAEVEVVRPQADDLASKRLERVRHEQELRRGVDVAAMPAGGIPCVSDLDAIDRCHDVVIARAADQLSGHELADRPGHHVSRRLRGKRVVDVLADAVGLGRRRVPELPEAAVGDGRGEAGLVAGSERLEADAVAFERDGRW